MEKIKFCGYLFLAPPVVTIGEGTEVAVEVGKSANFICTVLAYPLPLVEWKRNDSVLFSKQKSTANVSKKVEGRKTTLTFQIKVSKEDAGTYTCFSKNNQGNGSAYINLVVLRK